MTYTREKFLSFSLKKQHKKSAELLRLHYEQGASLSSYRDVETWLKLPPVALDQKALADRFHLHLKLASNCLKEHHFLKKPNRFDRLSRAPYLPIAIYLDHLRSAHNVGSILRTVEAFRLGTVHFSSEMPDVENKKVKDTSMGTAPFVPIKHTPLEALPKPLIILETIEDAPSLFDFPFPKVFTLVVGNEEYGVSDDALKKADHFVQIPLTGTKNSLNVACAFAIAAAEICR